MTNRTVRKQRDGLPDQLHRDVAPARLLCDDSQQVQRIGMVRLLIENHPVNGLGLRESSGLVVLERKINGLLDCEGWHRGHSVMEHDDHRNHAGTLKRGTEK